MTYSTTAILLHTRSIRESDRLFTVLTPERGKLELLGQGTRKAGSKLAGSMAVPGLLELHIVRGKAIDRLAGVEILRLLVQNTLTARMAAQAVLELVDRTTKHGKHDRALFELTLSTLDRISEAGGPLGSVIDKAAWNLLDVLGYRPRLDSCIDCGRRDDLVVFDPRGGGVLCASCRRAVTDDRPILPLPAQTAQALMTYLAEHLGLLWRGRAVFESMATL